MNKNNIIIALSLIMATHASYGMSSLTSKSSSRQSVEEPKEQKIITECLDANSDYNKEMKKIAQAALLPELWEIVCQYYEPSNNKSVDTQEFEKALERIANTKSSSNPKSQQVYKRSLSDIKNFCEKNEFPFYKLLETPKRSKGYLYKNTYRLANTLTFTKAKDRLILDTAHPLLMFLCPGIKDSLITWTIKDGACAVGSDSVLNFCAVSFTDTSDSKFLRKTSDDNILHATLFTNPTREESKYPHIKQHMVILHIDKTTWLRSVTGASIQKAQVSSQSQPSSSSK